MLPDDDENASRLMDAEKVIRALEALAAECEGRQLGMFANRIRLCVVKCQSDYVVLQRRAFAARAKKRRSPPTTH